MDHQTNANTFIHADDTGASPDETASTELTEMSAESLEWVAGGPNGSVVVIG